MNLFNQKEIVALEKRVEFLEFLICKGRHSFVRDIPFDLERNSSRTYISHTCEKCGKQIYSFESNL